MRDREPTIRSRELGEGLRKAMFEAGINGSEAARQLGWSGSRVSRLLSGRADRDRRARGHGGVVQAHGFHRVQAGGLRRK